MLRWLSAALSLAISLALMGAAPATAASGATITGANSGDVISPDTPLVATSIDGSPVLITIWALAPDGNVQQPPIRSTVISSGAGFTIRDVPTSTGAPLGGDFRIQADTCSPGAACVAGESLDLAVDAPINIYVHHTQFRNGHWTAESVWSSQTAAFSISVLDAGTPVRPAEALGQLQSSGPLYVDAVDDQGIPLPAERPYILRYDAQADSIVALGLHYSGQVEIPATAGDFATASMSQHTVVTVKDQSADSTKIRLHSLIAGKAEIGIFLPGFRDMTQIALRQVTPGELFEVQYFAGFDAGTAAWLPVEPGDYRVVARINRGDPVNTFEGLMDIGFLTVREGHWQLRPSSRRVSALHSLQGSSHGECRHVRTPASRRWPGSYELDSQPCRLDRSISTSWASHRASIPTWRYGWVSMRVATYGGAAVGSERSSALIETLRNLPASSQSPRLGWHRSSVIHPRDLIHQHRVDWRVSTTQGSAYDVKAFRLEFLVRDHPVANSPATPARA
jgi:hypothetical protein